MQVTVHLYRHRFLHWLYSIATTVVLLILITINNVYGTGAWTFDAAIVFFWFLGASYAASFYLSDAKFKGSPREIREYLDFIEGIDGKTDRE